MENADKNSVPTKLEKYLVITGWIGFSIYATYTAYRSATIEKVDMFGCLNCTKDINDDEWEIISGHIVSLLPWMLLHIPGSIFLQYSYLKVLPYFRICISVLFLLTKFGLANTSSILLLLIISFIIQLSQCRFLCWSFTLVTMTYYYHIRRFLMPYNNDYYKELLIIVMQGWLNLRCLSFSFRDRKLSDKSSTFKDFISFLHYSLYLPVLIQGPLLLYEDLEKNIPVPPWTKERIQSCLIKFIRIIIWFFFLETLFQLWFGPWINQFPYNLKYLSNDAVFSHAYFLAQIFMVKYVIYYGSGQLFASLEGIDAPNPPYCVSRIHLYSYMWRFFDVGLYNFLKRYIYVPLVVTRPHTFGKLFASAVTFGFVIVFHGLDKYIVVWIVMNFIAVTIESLAMSLSNTNFYATFEAKYLSSVGAWRFHGCLGGVLLGFSLISNFIFICGMETGEEVVKRIGNNGCLPSILLFICLYCFYQTGALLTGKEKIHRE